VVAGAVVSTAVVAGAAVVGGTVVGAIVAAAVEAGAAASSPHAATVAIDPMTSASVTDLWRYICHNLVVAVTDPPLSTQTVCAG
jgi:mannose/fructose/N-acetylgalactosamine-specific phosphotransferase system component IID